jgi:hypothetical protein
MGMVEHEDGPNHDGSGASLYRRHRLRRFCVHHRGHGRDRGHASLRALLLEGRQIITF